MITFRKILHLSYADKNSRRVSILSSLLVFLVLYSLLTWTVGFNALAYANLNGYAFALGTLMVLLGIAILTGINIALVRHRYLTVKKVEGKDFGPFVFLLSFFGTGCPVCGSLILGFFGIPLGLSVLPLKGLEINLLTLALLIMSTYYIGNITDKQCSSCKPRKK